MRNSRCARRWRATERRVRPCRTRILTSRCERRRGHGIFAAPVGPEGPPTGGHAPKLNCDGVSGAAGCPFPEMCDDREVVIQAPQDVFERSPGRGVRLAGRPVSRNPIGLSGLKALPRGCPRNHDPCHDAARTAGWPFPGMYGDRDVAIQAPQDVLERSPGMAVRLAGRPVSRNPIGLSGLKALPPGGGFRAPLSPRRVAWPPDGPVGP